MPEDRARGYTVPVGGDPFNVPGDMARLADDVATDVGSIAARQDRDAAGLFGAWPWGDNAYVWANEGAAGLGVWKDPPRGARTLTLTAGHLYQVDSTFGLVGVGGSPSLPRTVRYSLWVRPTKDIEAEALHQHREGEASFVATSGLQPVACTGYFRAAETGQHRIYSRFAANGSWVLQRSSQSPDTFVVDLGWRPAGLAQL